MTTFNWEIQSMTAYPQADEETNVVFEVNWLCQAQEGELGDVSRYQATSVGTVPVTYTIGNPFTPYNQLTQEQVWGWINSSIDSSEIEANLQLMIDAQKNPTVVTPSLPWSS
jgi:hypothetical protein